ncbi:MAG: alpha/beta hydrolase [Proteobacteria bacterium]|nr:alpha/beta hydrolase [Pseudomonadota bacterium]
MSIKRVTIEGDYSLESIVNEQGKQAGVVICHPHPLYGGDMNNNVVVALDEGFSMKGFTTLRFNFRGVGGSGGMYDKGEGEVNDVLAALTFLKRIINEDAYIILAGYSFGAWIASKAANKVDNISGLFIVAYPFSFYKIDPLESFKGKMYFVGGTMDDISPMNDLLMVYKGLLVVDKHLKIIPTSHFYVGKEREIVEFIRELVEINH